jgi:hypothetical protein
MKATAKTSRRKTQAVAQAGSRSESKALPSLKPLLLFDAARTINLVPASATARSRKPIV